MNSETTTVNEFESSEDYETEKVYEQCVQERKIKLIKEYSQRLSINGQLVDCFHQLITERETKSDNFKLSCVPMRKRWKKVEEALLCVAAAACEVAEVRAGLELGIPVSCELDHLSPLQHALSGAQGAPTPALEATVEMLLKAGANPKSKAKQETLVEKAMKHDHTKVANMLLGKLLSQEPTLDDFMKTKEVEYMKLGNPEELAQLLMSVEAQEKGAGEYLSQIGGKTLAQWAQELNLGAAASHQLQQTVLARTAYKSVEERQDMQRYLQEYPGLWQQILKSGHLMTKLEKNTPGTDELIFSFLFSDLSTNDQIELFGEAGCHDLKGNEWLPLQRCFIGEKTFLQHIADKKEVSAKLREEYIDMQIHIDEKLHPEESHTRATRVIEQLKLSIESGEPLIAWTDSVRSKLPITRVNKVVKIISALTQVFWSAGLLAFDIYSDAKTTMDFRVHYHTRSFGTSEVTTELTLCNYTGESSRSEAERYGAAEWNQLFIISISHLILPWVVFILAAIVTDEVWWKTVLNIICFPVSALLEKLALSIQMANILARDPKKQEVKDLRNEVNAQLASSGVKEAMLLTVEVTTESSFQFYLQSLLILPELYRAFSSAYEAGPSFGEHLFTLRYASIFSSFYVISRAFFKIRDLTKHEALSAHKTSSLILSLRIIIETVTRILSAGVFLYVLQSNMNPLMALGLYYGHVGIMIVFNLIFNSEECISGIYIFDLLLNSLSSTYAYTYYKYRRFLGKENDEVEAGDERFKSHQPTLVRQGLFYTIVVLENLSLTGVALLHFPRSGEQVLDDGYTRFCFSFKDLCNVVIAIWVLHFLQLALLVLYYANHPSSVSISPGSFRSKCKVAIQFIEL